MDPSRVLEQGYEHLVEASAKNIVWECTVRDLTHKVTLKLPMWLMVGAGLMDDEDLALVVNGIGVRGPCVATACAPSPTIWTSKPRPSIWSAAVA
jgi:hypothetical protein